MINKIFWLVAESESANFNVDKNSDSSTSSGLSTYAVNRGKTNAQIGRTGFFCEHDSTERETTCFILLADVPPTPETFTDTASRSARIN